jgi:hypothetical protein
MITLPANGRSVNIFLAAGANGCGNLRYDDLSWNENSHLLPIRSKGSIRI